MRTRVAVVALAVSAALLGLVGVATVAARSGEVTENRPLTVRVRAEPVTAGVGQEVVFTATATDPDGRIVTEGCGAPNTSFGDEEGVALADCIAACLAPSRFAMKPRPRRGTLTITYRHTYARPGTYTARFGFRSRMCSPYASRGEGTVDVTVVG
jgi:hypothetical protein